VNNQQTKHIGAAAPFWLRGPIALTADRWLVLDRAQAVEYQPVVDAQGRASVFDLASIHQPKDAVRFAEQHGLLWHGPDTPDLRELFTDWWEEANDLRKTLDLCLGLQRARAGNGSIRELRGWLGRSQGVQDADVLAQASVLLTNRVSQKLADCGLRLAANVQAEGAVGMFCLSPATASPLHHAYFQLAQLLANDVPLATCAEPLCARFFEQTDPRQHYCSPTCANRARQRRWAERARGTCSNPANDTSG